MKANLTLCLLSLLLSLVNANVFAVVVFTEDYPTTYGDGTALGANQTTGGYSTKWGTGNSTGSGNPLCTSAAALAYGPLQPISGVASYGFQCATAGSRDQSAGFASQGGDGNSVYVSFLVRVTAATPTARNLIGLRNSTGGGTLVIAAGINASRQLTLLKSGTAAATTTAALNQNETYFVVMRYRFVAGNGLDECALWLNPATGQTEEANAGVTPVITASGSDQNSLLSVRLPSVTDASGPLYLDEIRIGQTWADVTPSGGSVLGTKLGFTTPPAITQVNTPMNSVVVQVQNAGGTAVASNGVPVTLTLSSGSGVLSGTLTQNTDATGKATFANLSINTIGNDKQITATASGIGAGLTAAVSGIFSITTQPVISGLVITDAAMTPQGFRVDGNTDTPGGFTQVLGSSDAGREKTNWLIVAYQNADAGGLVHFTNPVSPAISSVFYQLRTGDTVTKLEPPSIGTAPQSQIVSPGTTATFAISGVGPQLQYLWYFNGNPIPGATNNSLVIPNVQNGNAGNYYVTVANPAGNLNSPGVTLGVGNISPTFVSQPEPQTVSAGGTALFHVTATGTAPLRYQWYVNTNTVLLDATNATLTLSGVSTNDNGKKYRVIVANGFGSIPSADANLTVTPVPTALPQTNLVGWAAAAGVTGGTGGTEVTVSDYAALRAACRGAGPIIIRVDGIIVPVGETYCYIEGYDKTIVGVGTNSGLAGYGFRANGTNIIIANLSFNSTNANSDGVTIDNSSHGTGRNIWVDHCTFYDCTDGSVDVTKGADYVTVSWSKFFYAPVPTGTVNHEFVNLIGSSDSDNAVNFHVTFHHNWYGPYCRERMPSVRFGRVHVFNNYYNCFDNNYCVRTRINAEVLVENNYFLGVQNPWERFVTSGSPGLLKASGNITNNCTFVNAWVSGAVVIPGNDTLGSELNPPPYAYTLTPASDVPYYIQTYSGHGKYPYAP